MKREIKFRAWVESGSKMLDWEYLKYKSDVGSVISGSYEGYHPMQFTGLLDKNGKEIYEGDILQNRNGVISEVRWDSEQSRWVSLSFGMTQKAIQRDKLFIIGNIYENPEILK